MHGDKLNAFTILVGEPGGKKHRHRREVNIKIGDSMWCYKTELVRLRIGISGGLL
jgi:hypothetical protein